MVATLVMEITSACFSIVLIVVAIFSLLVGMILMGVVAGAKNRLEYPRSVICPFEKEEGTWCIKTGIEYNTSGCEGCEHCHTPGEYVEVYDEETKDMEG